MTPTLELLNAVKKHQRVSSDYAVSKLLDISRARMSRYVNEHDEMVDEDLIIKAAELAGRDPLTALVQMYAGRTKSIPARKYWNKLQHLINTAGGATAVTLLALSATLAPHPSHANAVNLSGFMDSAVASSVYYVK